MARFYPSFIKKTSPLILGGSIRCMQSLLCNRTFGGQRPIAHLNRSLIRLPSYGKIELHGSVNKEQERQISPPTVNTFTSRDDIETHVGFSRAQAPQILPHTSNTFSSYGEFEPHNGVSRTQAPLIPLHIFNTSTPLGVFEAHGDASRAQVPHIPPHTFSTFTSHGEIESYVGVSKAHHIEILHALPTLLPIRASFPPP